MGVKHFSALDGVRGLAILLVLCYHLLQGNTVDSPVVEALRKIPGGMWVGVDLFFVLSGFLITGILFDSLQDEGYFRKFYGRRALRIFPLYYGLLLVLLVLTVPLHLEWQGAQWPLLLYLQNTPLLHPIFNFDLSRQVHLGHLWSLAVEEQFYLVWPVLVFWVKDLHKLIWTSLLGAAGALALRVYLLHAGTDPALVYVLTPCRADCLLLGAALALVLRSEWKQRMLAAANPLMCVSAVVLGVVVWYQGSFEPQETLSLTVGITLVALMSVGLIANTLHEGSRFRPVLEQRWLRFLGEYSYGIYIFHFPLDSWLTKPAREWLLQQFHSRIVAMAGGIVLVLAMTLVLSVTSFQLYEKRFLRLKKYFEYDAGVRTGRLVKSSGETGGGFTAGETGRMVE